MTRKSTIIIFVLALSALAAADFITDLRGRVEKYWQDKSNTRIHIKFHQPEYASGDTAYFSVAILQRQTLRPVSGSMIANVKLFRQSGEELLHSRFMCTDGAGAGQFLLPVGLEPGNYILQTYTDDNAERNDLTSVLTKELRIAGEKEFTVVETESWQAEGGSLVAGIRTRIAVRGMEKEKEIIVQNGSGEVVTSFTTSKSGSGSFFLTAAEGQQYIIQTTESRKKPIEAVRDGVALQAEVSGDGKTVAATVQIPESSQYRNAPLYLVMSSRGKVCYSKVVPNDALSKQVIDCRECPSGVAVVSVFNSVGPVANRLVYLPPVQTEIKITPDAQSYGVRKPVRINVEAAGLDGGPLVGKASISVYVESAFPASVPQLNATEALLLQWELASSAGPVPQEQSLYDEYLIAQKVRISWEEILAEKKNVTAAVSKKTYFFRGRVVSSSPVPDSTMVSFYVTSLDLVYRVYTSGNGTFEFPMFTDRPTDELYYRVSVKGVQLKDASIEIASGPALSPPANRLQATEAIDPYASLSRIKSPIATSFNYFAKKEDGEKDAYSTYADFDYDFETTFEKYKDFVSMKEAVIEVIPSVRPRRENGRDMVRVFIKETAMFAIEDPLIFIDGVITDSTGYFLNLVPAKVSRIKVLRSEETLSRFGELGKNGIIVVETRNPGTPAVPRSNHTLHINGISKAMPFRSPDYSATVKSRVPDLRTTLYWNPQLLIDKDGKASVTFYTGDATGLVRVHMEGVSIDGVPFRGDARFTVKASQP